VKTSQRGISLMGLIVGLFLLVILALFAMKVIPSYLEYSNAKTAIEGIARDPAATTPQAVRNAFEMRAAVDNMPIKAQDLEILKDGNKMAISFAYRKEVPLSDHVGVYIDYSANTKE
jgi:Tfp pilus assembly protein FimT